MLEETLEQEVKKGFGFTDEHLNEFYESLKSKPEMVKELQKIDDETMGNLF